MLPNRSKRYAGIDGEIPRLQLATGWHLLLITFLVGTLLVVIFPRRALVAKLYEQESLDDLTLSYIQNLYRADTRNLDVAILLARVEQDKLSSNLEQMLLNVASGGELRQRMAARTILLRVYTRRMAPPTDHEQVEGVKRRLSALLVPALQDPLPPHMAQQFADLAFTLDRPDLGLLCIEKMNAGDAPLSLEHYARRALGMGHYQQAARYYFLAQQHADDGLAQRRLFMAGVDTLMADGLYADALAAARTHGAQWVRANDRIMLRYLARMALTAGNPQEAADYAKALVFQTPGAPR